MTLLTQHGLFVSVSSSQNIGCNLCRIIRELVQAIIAKQAEQYPSIHASCTDIFLLCSDWKGGHPDLREELYRTKEMNQPGQSSTIRGHKTDTKECIILFSPVIIAVRALYIRHQ